MCTVADGAHVENLRGETGGNSLIGEMMRKWNQRWGYEMTIYDHIWPGACALWLKSRVRRGVLGKAEAQQRLFLVWIIPWSLLVAFWFKKISHWIPICYAFRLIHWCTSFISSNLMKISLTLIKTPLSWSMICAFYIFHVIKTPLKFMKTHENLINHVKSPEFTPRGPWGGGGCPDPDANAGVPQVRRRTVLEKALVVDDSLGGLDYPWCKGYIYIHRYIDIDIPSGKLT